MVAIRSGRIGTSAALLALGARPPNAVEIVDVLGTGTWELTRPVAVRRSFVASMDLARDLARQRSGLEGSRYYRVA